MPDSERARRRRSRPPEQAAPETESLSRPAPPRYREIFHAAIETTRMPMVVTDARSPDHPILYANHAFLRMTGYDAAEVLGRNCRFLQGPETDRATLATLRRAIAEEREIALEVLNYRKNGSSFWNALFVSPIHDEQGELAYFFGSQLDVSRRRDAEDALRQSQKMEALGQLTGGIAHDFNNLLQVMQGYLELIAVGLDKPAPDRDRLKRALDHVRGAAGRAGQLTQQLLAFARKQQLDGRPLNLNSLVEGMRDLAGRTLGDAVALRLRPGTGLWACRLDPTQAELALLNLLINARDAMVPGRGAEIGVATRNLRLDAAAAAEFAADLPAGDYVLLEVADNGCGMAPGVMARVLDPFFTTKEEGKGTGLGLSMVYGFARQSGGGLRLRSIEGEGTVLQLAFPALAEEARAAVPRGLPGVEAQGHETILLVEDRADVAGLAREILEDFGYRVLLASQAEEALAVLDGAQGIDLLFSDLVMPGPMNGVMLAREARRRRPRLKVLLTTGYAEAATAAGRDGRPLEFEVIGKPYGRLELSRKVRLILDGPNGVS
ncbi:histidine kinase famiy protein [Roseomonas sp. 18066]|uniref:histidine kinase famiy protein n=1 Tax=Roseomonas sp. 18066 TaxID=2681412 RepID=UPI0013595C6A|nr:histidine kinase famiy protein [Roseomonas sp. 18066]